MGYIVEKCTSIIHIYIYIFRHIYIYILYHLANSLIPEWILFFGWELRKNPPVLFWFGGNSGECQSDRVDVQVRRFLRGRRWPTVCLIGEMTEHLGTTRLTHKNRALPKGTNLDRKFKQKDIEQVGLVSKRDTEISFQNGFFSQESAMVLQVCNLETSPKFSKIRGFLRSSF